MEMWMYRLFTCLFRDASIYMCVPKAVYVLMRTYMFMNINVFLVCEHGVHEIERRRCLYVCICVSTYT